MPLSWQENQSRLQSLQPPRWSETVKRKCNKIHWQNIRLGEPNFWLKQKTIFFHGYLLTSIRPSLPGTVGTPAFFIVSRAVALSPIILILSGCKEKTKTLACLLKQASFYTIAHIEYTLHITHVWPDKVDPMISTDINKCSVFREKTITRVKHCTSTGHSCRNYVRNHQITEKRPYN